MSIKSSSVLVLALVTVFTSFTSFAFPSFNKQNDISKILFTALTSSGAETSVKLDGKTYKVTIAPDTFGPLVIELQFAKTLLEVKAAPTEKDMRAWLAFYSEGLESKTLTFKVTALEKALDKIKDAKVLTGADKGDLVDGLKAAAEKLKAGNADVIDQLEELTELDKKAGMFKKTTLSADKKTQTYEVSIGGVVKTFTVAKA